MKPLLSILFLVLGLQSYAQIDSSKVDKLSFTGDFRGRIEHDWDSQNANGVQRDDRSRLRYRLRFGFNYALDKHSSLGARIRSGNINDQQGPHVTLGGGDGEFGLVKIGLEKLFYQFKSKHFKGWIGKNTMPLMKLNELFWNDNVFPDGVGLQYQRKLAKAGVLGKIGMNAGHFIIRSNNKLFKDDSYLQIAQLNLGLWDDRVSLFPGIYYFNKVGNYPDGKHTFELDYSIVHLGSQFVVSPKHGLRLGVELYQNLENYTDVDEVSADLRGQKSGFVASVRYGDTKKKGDWLLYLAYANIEKYAIVDYFAQNDWSRWDYSSVGAAGSRISNFEGIEIRAGYAFSEQFNLILRSYFVEQLVKTGDFKENGSRVRLDLNIGF